MPAETCYHIMELLSDPLGPEWEASRQIIEHENRDNWSRACGLWVRPDLRPKISTKQEKLIATQTRMLDLPNWPNINQLNVQIPTGTVSSSSVETTQGEHSPEWSTPVTTSRAMPREDDPNAEGPKTPETATGSSAQETIILREGSTCRVSLTEPERTEDAQSKTRHNSAAQ